MVKRIEYIDVAKGFAILCVVIGHVLCYDLYGFQNAWESELCSSIYKFHMPLFMLLSGLLSVDAIELRALPKDVVKRFNSLLIPFFVVGSIFSLLYFRDFLFLKDQMKRGYWYLWVLFVFYMITYPIGIVKKRICLFTIYIFYILLWLGYTSIFYRFVSDEHNNLFSMAQVGAYFPYFLFGNIIKRHKLYDFIFANQYILLVALLFLFSDFLFDISFKYCNYIRSFSLIIFIINGCRRISISKYKRIKYMFMYLGTHTLYIYLFHYFFLMKMQVTFLSPYLLQYSNVFVDLFLCILPSFFAISCSIIIKEFILGDSFLSKCILGRSKK